MLAMASNQTSARFPWVALTLSFLSSGVGHIYCGHIVKGLFLYSARFLLPLLCIVAAFIRPSNAVFVGMILVPGAAIIGVYLYSSIDAYAIARRSSPDYELKEYNRSSVYWLLIAMQLAYPVALTLGIREYVYEPFFLPERSMSPNFLPNDRILVNKLRREGEIPERGEVVVFRTPPSEPGRNWIKRVIGLPGDRIVIKGKTVEVNGKELPRERVSDESIASIREQVEGNVYYESLAGRRYRVIVGDDFSEQPSVNESSVNETDSQPVEEDRATDEFRITVPDHSVFLMGDNRDLSRDSRSIGSIHVSDVVGYVDYNYCPAKTWSRFGVCRD